METIHRFTKDTLRGRQMWETTITETSDKIVITKLHLMKDTFEIIKEVEEEITKQQAEKYKKENKRWHIETYNK